MANTLLIEKVAENLFEHTLNDEQATTDNAPCLTTFRNVTTSEEWLDFKSKNGAPLISRQRIAPTEVTITDTYGGTGTFTGFTNAIGIWLKLSELGYFVGYGIDAGSGGVNRFRNLLDVYPPLTYSGQDGKVYVVNEAQNRVDATEFYNKRLFSQLDDVATGTLTTDMDGKLLQISIVMGEPKITLLNIPALSDSLKQTYKIRLDKVDAPDDESVLEKLSTYGTAPFDAGIIPNDMGGIIVEVYDFVLEEVFAIYEIVNYPAGSNLADLVESNVFKLETYPSVSTPTLPQVLTEGNVSENLGFKIGVDNNGFVEVLPYQVIGENEFPASVTVGKGNSGGRYIGITPEEIQVTNSGTTDNLFLRPDQVAFNDGSHDIKLIADFTGLTTDVEVNFRPIDGTVALLSDLSSAQSLQQVTDVGSTTTNGITVGGTGSFNGAVLLSNESTNDAAKIESLGTDIELHTSNGVIFRGIISGGNTFFQIGDTSANAIFSAKNGTYFNSLAFNSVSTNFNGGNITVSDGTEGIINFSTSSISDDGRLNLYSDTILLRAGGVGDAILSDTELETTVPVRVSSNLPYQSIIDGGQIEVKDTGSTEKTDYFWNRIRWTDASSKTQTLTQANPQTNSTISNQMPDADGQLVASISGSATLDFGNTSSGESNDLTITVTGAVSGDIVALGTPSLPDNCCYTAFVSGTNTVTVRFNNYSGSSIDPASGTFKVKILR